MKKICQNAFAARALSWTLLGRFPSLLVDTGDKHTSHFLPQHLWLFDSWHLNMLWPCPSTHY